MSVFWSHAETEKNLFQLFLWIDYRSSYSENNGPDVWFLYSSELCGEPGEPGYTLITHNMWSDLPPFNEQIIDKQIPKLTDIN